MMLIKVYPSTDVSASSAAIYFQDPVRAASQGTIRVAAAGETLIGALNGIFLYRRKHK